MSFITFFLLSKKHNKIKNQEISIKYLQHRMHIEIVRASISIQFDTVDSIKILMYRPNLIHDFSKLNQHIIVPLNY